MWAMIEKLRMCWSGRAIPASEARAAPESTCDKAADLVCLFDPQHVDRADVNGDARRDAESERYHLADQRPAQRVVEAVPHGVADGREQCRGAEHLEHRRQGP